LPGESEEVEPRDGRHSAAMADRAVFGLDQDVDPGVVEAEAGCPDHSIECELAAIGEADRVLRDARQTWLQLHPGSLEHARARTNERVTTAQLLAEPRVHSRVEKPRRHEPP